MVKFIFRTLLLYIFAVIVALVAGGANVLPNTLTEAWGLILQGGKIFFTTGIEIKSIQFPMWAVIGILTTVFNTLLSIPIITRKR